MHDRQKQRRVPLFSLKRRVWALAAVHLATALASGLLNLYLVVHFAVNGEYSSLGFVLAARTLPILLVALWGSNLADRFNRAKLAGFTLVVAGLFNLLTVSALELQLQFVIALVFSLLSGLAGALGAPAMYALLPQIAAGDSLFAANGLVRTCRNSGTIFSPVLFGLLSLWADIWAGYLAAVLAIAGGAALLLFFVPAIAKAAVSAPAARVSALVDAKKLVI